MKKYKCRICERLSNRIKSEKEFIGTRQVVRKHLRDVHHIVGRSREFNINRKEKFGESELTKNTRGIECD